jgi:phosphatidylinositol glycan class B
MSEAVRDLSPESMPGGMNDHQWRGLLFKWMGLSLVFHVIASWYSVGHHSVDEYFQILEFLNYRRGGTPDYDLAVEFHEKMRPWMQPFLYAQLIRLMEALGIQSPFAWTAAMRFLTGLLGWAASVGLAIRAREWFRDSPQAQKFCVYALALMWFLPALHVRPSSEGLTGSAFLVGLVLLTSAQLGVAQALAGGALLGLSFEARFQTGFMIAGLLAWMGWKAWAARAPRQHVRPLIATVAGLALVIALGRWIDRWGYGEWVLSPLRYVDYNLLRGEVNRYGQSPPWDVFRMAFTESWPFLGLTLAIANVVAWIRHPRHPLTWSYVPFFLVHIAIAHKELRFFFPIAVGGPVLLTMALTSAGRPGQPMSFLNPGRVMRPWIGTPTRWYWRFLLINNFVALAALLMMPFARPVEFYRRVWDLIPAGTQRFEILFRGTDPYHLLGNPVYFYRPPALVTQRLERYEDLAPRLQSGETLWVFEPRFELPDEGRAFARQCTPAVRSLPSWVVYLNFNGWLARAHAWTLFECKSSPLPQTAQKGDR